ncbi:MAG: serine protein kinase, partial [Pseudomonadota bacterium]
MASTDDIFSVVDRHVNPDRFREQHWEGTFADYIDIVTSNPRVARDAFQRIYDMIMHFGCERYTWMRRELMRYRFFDDPIDKGADAIFGLDRALMN